MICRHLVGGTALQYRSNYTFGRYDTPPKEVVSDHCDTSAKHYHYNRNPRNSELLLFKPRTTGYTSDSDWIPTNYYNRIELRKTGKHISAHVSHFESGEFLSVSTSEPWIRSKLYRTYDQCAALNIGRILAYRMKACGIYCAMFWDPLDSEYYSKKTESFLSGLKMEGVEYKEPRPNILYWQVMDEGETPHFNFDDSDKLLSYLYRKAEARKQLLDE